MDLGDENLKPIRVLGQGSFGRVILCKNLNNKTKTRDVCVKRIIVQNPKAEMNMIMEEVNINYQTYSFFLKWFETLISACKLTKFIKLELQIY